MDVRHGTWKRSRGGSMSLTANVSGAFSVIIAQTISVAQILDIWAHWMRYLRFCCTWGQSRQLWRRRTKILTKNSAKWTHHQSSKMWWSTDTPSRRNVRKKELFELPKSNFDTNEKKRTRKQTYITVVHKLHENYFSIGAFGMGHILKGSSQFLYGDLPLIDRVEGRTIVEASH